VALKLVYIAVSRLFAWAGLAARDSAAKEVEILILRHQLAVAQRRDPRLARKLTWADRAWLALLAGLIPKHRIGRIRWFVRPETLIRWHRDLLRRSWARRSAGHRGGREPTATSRRWSFGWRARILRGGIAGSMASWPALG
jgi:putative transposase